MSFLLAMQFLTSIPVPTRRAPRPGETGGSTIYFPLVGLIIGLLLAGVNWLVSLVLPAGIDNVLVLAVLVLLTGAIHLDGFMDTFDGTAGHHPKEERWRIMRDSRVGAFGVIAVLLLLLTKYIALDSLPIYAVTPVLLFMPVASRWAMVYAIFAFPYARESGLGFEFKERTRWGQFVVATLTTLLVAIALIPLFGLKGLAVILLAWIGTMLFSLYFKGKFGGLTGDNYGAVNEIAEVMVLLFVIALDRFAIL